LVVIRSVPCAQSFSREELPPISQLAGRVRWCSVLQKVRPTYYEWHFIHVRFPRTIQQLQIPFGLHSSLQELWTQKSVSMYRAPHGYSWVSSVMGIACTMTVVLRPVHSPVSVYLSIAAETRLIAKHYIVR